MILIKIINYYKINKNDNCMQIINNKTESRIQLIYYNNKFKKR